jgi:hypothetical protein
MIIWAGFVVLVYDYMLTFDTEVCLNKLVRSSLTLPFHLAALHLANKTFGSQDIIPGKPLREFDLGCIPRCSSSWHLEK